MIQSLNRYIQHIEGRNKCDGVIARGAPRGGGRLQASLHPPLRDRSRMHAALRAIGLVLSFACLSTLLAGSFKL